MNRKCTVKNQKLRKLKGLITHPHIVQFSKATRILFVPKENKNNNLFNICSPLSYCTSSAILENSQERNQHCLHLGESVRMR